MSIVSVKTAIVAKLNDMGTLKGVFNFPTGNPDAKFPYASVTVRDGDGRFGSTAHNIRRRGYWIRVYQEQSKEGQGVQQAESITAAVMDEIEIAFDMDTTLSGACKYTDVTSFDASYVDREFDTRILEIQVDAFQVVDSK